MEEFPDEEFNDETLSAVMADLRRRVRSQSASTSSSSGTARPRLRVTSRASVHSSKGHVSHAGLGALDQGTSYVSNVDSQLSALTESPTGSNGTLLDVIHTGGSKIPESVKDIAGPFQREDFIRLHIDKTEV
jgi:hypothetical protein